MRFRCWLILLIILSCVSCRPRMVLSNREMRDVLYDLHRADGALQVAGYSHGHSQELSAYYKSVLDKHGITQAEFDSSLVWFTDNPQIFNKIYPKVIARLEADFNREDDLRNERLGNQKNAKEKNKEKTKSLPSIERLVKENLYGIEIRWKEWQGEEFCEKNVIIFGQFEKK